MARSALPGELAPVHVAFCAAVPRRALLPVAGAAWASVWIGRGAEAAALDALVLAALVGIRLRLPASADALPRRAGWVSAALAGGCAGAVGTLWSLAAGAGWGGVVTAWFRAAAAGALAPLLAGALRVLAGWAAQAGSRPVRVGREEALLVGTLAGAVLVGLDGLRLGPVDAMRVPAAALAMAAAWAGGPGLGAATAAACAGLAAVLGHSHPVALLSQVVGGLLAGALRPLGAAGVLGGHGLGVLVLSALYREPEEVWVALASWVAGAALWWGLARVLPAGPRAEFLAGSGAGWLVPARAPAVAALGRAAPIPVRSGGNRFLRGSSGAEPGAPEGEGAAAIPSADGPAYSGVAPAVVLLSKPAAVGSPASGEGGDAWEGLARACRELAEAVARPEEPEEATPGALGAAELVGALAGRVCTGCPHVGLCWQRDFLRTYAGLMDALLKQEARGCVEEQDLPEHLRRRCPRLPALTVAIQHLYELGRAEQRQQQRLREHRELLAQQLLGVGEAVRRLRRHAARSPSPPRMGYRVGVVRIPRVPGAVSGDSCLTRMLPDGRLALAISDGMGTGERAAQQSRAALRLLERLLSAGFDERDAVRTVNAVLMLRAAADAYATLDLALVDLSRGHTRFVKMGAAPSLLVRNGRVRVVRGGAPPAGILLHMEAEVRTLTLMPGDMMIMLSDGVLMAWPRADAAEDWLCGFLAGFPGEDPQRVAAAIAEEVLRRSAGQARDDVTVLALSLR